MAGFQKVNCIELQPKFLSIHKPNSHLADCLTSWRTGLKIVKHSKMSMSDYNNSSKMDKQMP